MAKKVVPACFHLDKVARGLWEDLPGLNIFPITNGPNAGFFIDSEKDYPRGNRTGFDITICTGTNSLPDVSLQAVEVESSGRVRHMGMTWYVFVAKCHGCIIEPRSEPAVHLNDFFGMDHLIAGEYCPETREGRVCHLLELLKAMDEPQESPLLRMFRLEQHWAMYDKPVKGVEKIFPIRSGSPLGEFLGVELSSDLTDKPGTFRLKIGPHDGTTDIPPLELRGMKPHLLASVDRLGEKRFVFATYTSGGVYSVHSRNYWVNEFGKAQPPAQGAVLPCWVVGTYCPTSGTGRLFRLPDESLVSA